MTKTTDFTTYPPDREVSKLLMAGMTIMKHRKLDSRLQHELISAAGQHDLKARSLGRAPRMSDYDLFEQMRINELADSLKRTADKPA